MTEQNPAPDIEQFIQEAFDQNYETLRIATARTLSPAGREAARRQVLMYWRKLRHIAERITDTEVRLTLPNQKSPAKRKYSIHGVVDIVRDDDRVVMYDIKTHDAKFVSDNPGDYTDQLNVYAHIWTQLRGQPLDEVGIIGTRLPPEIHRALEEQDEQRLQIALQDWNPVVIIPFDPIQVEETIEEFGEVVDDIEDHRFRPPSVRDLRKPVYGSETFAIYVCRQCDARFSCDTYRRYMRQDQSGHDEKRYWTYFEDFGLDEEQEMWRAANLEAAPTVQDLTADFA